MLRSLGFLRCSTRLALLLPFAAFAAACGSDDGNAIGNDSGGAPVTEGGSMADGGSATDGARPAPDTSAPTVLSSSPVDAAVGASNTGEITATFSEGMAATTLTSGATFTLSRAGVVVPGVVTYFDNTVSFVPASDLSLNTTYTATISTAATDLAGNAMVAPYTWSFKTDATAPAGPAPVLLGAAGKYVVLATSASTNVPTSKITGNVALSPAAASYITGFGLTKAGTKWTSPQVTGGVFAADNDPPTSSNLTTAIGNMQTAYTDAAGRPNPSFVELGAGSIGPTPLVPGLYKWTSSVTIPGDIVIAGAANDVWIFQISGDLVMSAGKKMTLSGGARAKNVFWQVAGLVDLGNTSHGEGIMISKTAIKLATGASLNGRLLAQTAVTLAGNTIKAPAP